MPAVSSAAPEASGEPIDDAPGPSRGQQASEHEIAIGGRLARAVGADRASFSRLIDVAMQSADARVCAAALRVGLRILDTEPDLQASMLYTLDRWRDEHEAGDPVAALYPLDVAAISPL